MFLDVQFHLLENLALDVLSYLLLLVPSRFEPLVKGFVFAAHEDDEVEVFGGEDIGTVKIKKQSSCSDIVIAGDVIDQFLLTELGHVELFIPMIVELVIDDEFSHGEVVEVERLIEQLAESGLSCSWSAGDEDVWGLATDGLLFDHCCRIL